MYGFLDASADTQWIRIMPVRDSLLYQPGKIDATVTLKELETGETVTLNDSLFHFLNNRYAHNFWTTESLKPSGTYRLKAERSDGAASHATITLPADFPTPIAHIREPDSNSPDLIEIDGIEKLVDAQVLYYVQNQRFPVIHLKDTVVTTDDSYQLLLEPEEDIQSIRNKLGEWFLIPPEDRIIYIAAATDNFPDFATLDEKIIALPEGITNVENGVGYVGGIVSKTIPYRSCFNNDQNRIPCPLIK